MAQVQPIEARRLGCAAWETTRWRAWPVIRWRRCLVWWGTALCGVLVLIANDRFLRMAARENPASRVNWLFLSSPTRYDVAILGSSMAKESVDPEDLQRRTGATAVQLAWGGRGVSEQALYWKLFLQRHGCRVLLLELHPRGLERDVLPHPLDEFRYVARLDDPTIRQHLTREFGAMQVAVWRWVPMWAMAQFSTQIGWHDVLSIRRGDRFDPNIPAANASRKESVDLERQRLDPDTQPGRQPVDERAVAWFREIVAAARQRGIDVVAIVPPVYRGFASEEMGWLNRYRELLGPDTPVFVPDGDYLHDQRNFADAWHVNARGRAVYT
ncbi:MAG: hypothetical protein D6753_17505, partial [Planctomycetota bacterium]